jgi:hypothetical protein
VLSSAAAVAVAQRPVVAWETPRRSPVAEEAQPQPRANVFPSPTPPGFPVKAGPPPGLTSPFAADGEDGSAAASLSQTELSESDSPVVSHSIFSPFHHGIDTPVQPLGLLGRMPVQQPSPLMAIDMLEGAKLPLDLAPTHAVLDTPEQAFDQDASEPPELADLKLPTGPPIRGGAFLGEDRGRSSHNWIVG